MQSQAVELSWGSVAPVFFSWIRNHTASQEDRVELSRQLGEKLGLQEGEQVGLYIFKSPDLLLRMSVNTEGLQCATLQGFLRPCGQVQSVRQVSVEPLSSDDWEILVSPN